MTAPIGTSSLPNGPIPADDPQRTVTVARPEQDESLPHIGVVGDTYTVLLDGGDTAGRFCLIDMYVPPGGGPAPHRHDFEETFSLLQGEIEVTFRDEKLVVRTGETVNVPSNAPHEFHNASDQPARLLCICSPAGQEAFFAAIGQPVAGRTEAPPPLDGAEQQAFIREAGELALRYRSELLTPS